ncbi:hypothetical protein KM043_003901 [Ampulex compressa]|nr:hypothetical protein KM043_003901 [Ampulex compressa]
MARPPLSIAFPLRKNAPEFSGVNETDITRNVPARHVHRRNPRRPSIDFERPRAAPFIFGYRGCTRSPRQTRETAAALQRPGPRREIHRGLGIRAKKRNGENLLARRPMAPFLISLLESTSATLKTVRYSQSRESKGSPETLFEPVPHSSMLFGISELEAGIRERMSRGTLATVHLESDFRQPVSSPPLRPTHPWKGRATRVQHARYLELENVFAGSVWLKRHVSHASRDDSALRACQGKQWANPSRGAARKHRLAAPLTSGFSPEREQPEADNRFPAGRHGQSFHLIGPAGAKGEMLGKSSRRKRTSGARKRFAERPGPNGGRAWERELAVVYVSKVKHRFGSNSLGAPLYYEAASHPIGLGDPIEGKM